MSQWLDVRKKSFSSYILAKTVPRSSRTVSSRQLSFLSFSLVIFIFIFIHHDGS